MRISNPESVLQVNIQTDYFVYRYPFPLKFLQNIPHGPGANIFIDSGHLLRRYRHTRPDHCPPENGDHILHRKNNLRILRSCLLPVSSYRTFLPSGLSVCPGAKSLNQDILYYHRSPCLSKNKHPKIQRLYPFISSMLISGSVIQDSALFICDSLFFQGLHLLFPDPLFRDQLKEQTMHLRRCKPHFL